MEKTVYINLDYLKNFDAGYFSQLQAVQSNWKVDYAVEINLTFPFDEKKFKQIDKAFKLLLAEYHLTSHYDELLAWYPSLSDMIEKSKLEYLFAEEARESVEYLIKLLEFREKLNSDHTLEVNIMNQSLSDESGFVTLKLPITDAIPNELFTKAITNFIDETIDSLINQSYTFSLTDWMPKTFDSSKNLRDHLDKLPFIYRKPLDNQRIAYAVEQWLKYLNQKHLFSFEGDFFSNDQSNFIRNYMTLFELLPGTKGQKDKSLIMELDINFNNNLRYSLKVLRRFRKAFVRNE